MREVGSTNYHYTTPEGYTFDEKEGNLFYLPINRKKEAYAQFKRIILPIINQHLRNISDERVKSLKKQYFKEFFEKIYPK